VAMRTGKIGNLIGGDINIGDVVVTFIYGTEPDSAFLAAYRDIQLDARLVVHQLVLVHQRVVADRTFYLQSDDVEHTSILSLVFFHTMLGFWL